METTPTSHLHFDRSALRRHGPGGIVAIFLRQKRMERALARRQVHFRSTDPILCGAAYAAMTAAEFDAINGPQNWANWRTIPRALDGRLPDRPLRILDLGCGTGSSTRILAHLAPPASTIFGYELATPLVNIARTRSYTHACGAVADVRFVSQPITETLRDADGQALAERSVDLVNASGVIGHHLTEKSIGPLIDEMLRVLTPNGLALLDVGPTLRAPALERVMITAGFRSLGRFRSWLFDPTGQVLFVAPSTR